MHKREFHCRHPERQWRHQGVRRSLSCSACMGFGLAICFFWGGGGRYFFSAGWNIFMHTRKCNFAHKCKCPPASVKFKCNFGGIARDSRRDLRIVSTFISNLLSPTLREINVGFWGHILLPVCPPIVVAEQSTVSVAITWQPSVMTTCGSHLRELRDFPETPALSCVSRPDSRVQTVPSFYHDQEQTSR